MFRASGMLLALTPEEAAASSLNIHYTGIPIAAIALLEVTVPLLRSRNARPAMPGMAHPSLADDRRIQ